MSKKKGPLVNRLVKRIKKVRKRYIVDVPPEKLAEFNELLLTIGLEFVEHSAEGAVRAAKER